jgi:phospholipid/cholesterol/gamma-HCH transport system substrate-binding protein
MRNKKIDNAKVGLLVLSGLLFLVFTLYMIGKNRNLFGSTFTIKAVLNNVNGLVPGNNVRFKGMDVGTVQSLVVANDTAIYVTMTIDEKMKPYIKQNAIASVGTDGLMGNKLININSDSAPSEPVEKDDVIQSRKPVETDEMLRTLNTTNTNIERITHNLFEITVKLNSSESLWTLLSDTVITKDLKHAVSDFKKAGANTANMTLTANNIVRKLENGNGIANKLFTDTTLVNQLTNSLNEIKQASHQTSTMMKDLQTVVDDMKQGDGPAGLILTDTLLRTSLFKSAINIEQGTDRFNQNMEALKSNFLFRRHFKKLEKQQNANIEAKKNNN